MKDLKCILLEKFIINKNTKVKKELSESEIDDLIEKYGHNVDSGLRSDLYYNSPAVYNSHLNKMKGYMDKGSKPERLVATIKNKEKLIKRWDCAMILGWLDAANVFKEEIIKRRYYDNDELMAYIVAKVKGNRDKYKIFLQ